jgi:hypothetical protein
MGKFWRILQWKMLVYFKDIWSILQQIGIFYAHLEYITYGLLVYFSPFWYVAPRKIWQPWLEGRLCEASKLFARNSATNIQTFAHNISFILSYGPTYTLTLIIHWFSKQHRYNVWQLKRNAMTGFEPVTFCSWSECTMHCYCEFEQKIIAKIFLKV